jgi:hypothetical protein
VAKSVVRVAAIKMRRWLKRALEGPASGVALLVTAMQARAVEDPWVVDKVVEAREVVVMEVTVAVAS